MLTKRIIPCLDVKNGKVVKGINFNNLSDVGNPVKLAKKYYDNGADELCFLDITASIENRGVLKTIVKEVAQNIFIPFTVGGGISSITDIEELLQSGADKVSICTAAVKDPKLIKQASMKFGSQCIVISIDVKNFNKSWKVCIYGGKTITSIDAIDFAKQCEKLDAGEILLNSIDRDGVKKGYDLEILEKISASVSIPVIASSGAGNLKQIADAFTIGRADAALAASIFHSNEYTIKKVKKYLLKQGIAVRPC